MKRLLAIILLLALGLPGALPLFAFSDSAENKLPACCRRNGTHHCTSPVSVRSSSDATTISAQPVRCPMYPGVLPSGLKSSYALTSVSLFNAALADASATASPTLGSPLNAFSFNRQTRGPPVVLPSVFYNL